MKIEDVLKHFTAKDKTKIKTLHVRELDEEEPGCFVAFVDDVEDTYDVQVQLVDQEVQQLSCDCGAERMPCTHQAAVLFHLSERGLKVQPSQLTKRTKAKARVSVSEVLLHEQSKETLTQWLTSVFKKNKTLEQQFIVTFSQEKTNYTTEYVVDIILQTCKAVAGKRKTLEGVKIKKILDTLAIAFEPVNDFITVNMGKPIASELVIAILITLKAFDKRISHHSKKFDDFYQHYSEWFALTFNNIQHEKQWLDQVNQLATAVFVQQSSHWTMDCLLLRKVYENGSATQQKSIGQVVHQSLLQSPHTRYDYKVDDLSFFRDIALTHDFYEEVYAFFKLRD